MLKLPRPNAGCETETVPRLNSEGGVIILINAHTETIGS